MTSPFIVFVCVLGAFFTYLIALSVDTSGSGPKTTCTGNLHPSVTSGKNLKSIGRHTHPQGPDFILFYFIYLFTYLLIF